MTYERAALVAEEKLAANAGDRCFHEAKIETARFFADHVLVQAPALRNTVVNGANAEAMLPDM